MLGQRRRRWTSIKPTLGQRLVFANWDEIHTITFTQNVCQILECGFSEVRYMANGF